MSDKEKYCILQLPIEEDVCDNIRIAALTNGFLDNDCATAEQLLLGVIANEVF